MPHSFSNCPLRSSTLLITNHSTQSIVAATDEVLDALGYTLSDIIGQHMQCLNIQLSAHLTPIPECTLRHSSGRTFQFQVCVHQDPLGSTTCLDYWLFKLIDPMIVVDKLSDTALLPAPAIAIIRLSPYGTIEQVQPAPNIKQSAAELLGRPVMAYIYEDDVQPLVASLAKLCTSPPSSTLPKEETPLFIRWSRLPYLLETTVLDQEESLNYDWMSFTLMTTNTSNTPNSIRPVCIIRALQVPVDNQTCEESLVLHTTAFDQILDGFKQMVGNMIQVVEKSTSHGKVYLGEFYHHIIYSLIGLISSYVTNHNLQSNPNCGIEVGSHVFTVIPSKEDTTAPSGYIWDFLKSSFILQRSLGVLQTTGILDQQHFKSYMETLAT